MTSDIDPEVLVLLQEVLEDPSSTLTRTPERGFSSWLERREPVTAGEPLLSRAEKHLVRAHREAVAMLLYQACQREVMEAPSPWMYFCRRRAPDDEISPVDPELWRKRAVQTLELSPGTRSLEENTVARILEDGTSPPQPSRLAAASLNLVPRDETRIWLGLASQHQQDMAVARQCFVGVLSGRPSALNQAWSLLDLGSIDLRVGKVGEAWNLYRMACRHDDELPLALAFWLNVSLLVNNREDLFEASVRLQEVASPEHPFIAQCSAILGMSYKTWLPFPDSSRQLLDQVRDKLSATAQAVLHNAF